MNLKNLSVLISIVLILFLIAINCSKNGSNTSTPTVTPNTKTNIDQNGIFGQYIVSQAELDLLSSQAFKTSHANHSSFVSLEKKITKDVYSELEDEFDFIIFYLKNPSNPSHGIVGRTQLIQNEIDGLGNGISKFDHTSEYGSSSELKSIVYLYSFLITPTNSNLLLLGGGPIVHEIGHKWFCYSTATSDETGHWKTDTYPISVVANRGIFGAINNEFDEAELYLMGLVDYSEISDTESKAVVDLIRNEDGVRNPNAANSQKSFRGLVLIITTALLSDTEATSVRNNINSITSRNVTDPNTINFYRQTRNKATLKLDGLNNIKR